MPKLLSILADNTALLEETKEVILKQFADVPYAEGASDELLGQITRARLVGRQKVEEAFKYIESFKTNAQKSVEENPGY